METNSSASFIVHFYLQNRRDGVELGDDSAVVGVGAADQRLRRIRARLRYEYIGCQL